jgi:hypothetical protein
MRLEQHNPFREPELLHPELAAAISHAEAWQADHDMNTEPPAFAKFIVATANRTVMPELEPSFERVVETAHDVTTNLFDRISILIPELAEFAEAGVDFKRLAGAHKKMADMDLKPSLVLAPVLSVEQWESVFLDLRKNPRVNDTTFREKGGLYVDDVISEQWGRLQSSHVIKPKPGQQDWQVALIPGTNTPPIDNVDHKGVDKTKEVCEVLRDEAMGIGLSPSTLDFHPSIATYLTMQASKIYSNEKFVDTGHFTWLDGSLVSGSLAPCGRYIPRDGEIHIDVKLVSNRGSDSGVRLPVWGDNNSV